MDRGLHYHLYADDNEFCLPFRPLDPTSVKDTVQRLEVMATNIKM